MQTARRSILGLQQGNPDRVLHKTVRHHRDGVGRQSSRFRYSTRWSRVKSELAAWSLRMKWISRIISSSGNSAEPKPKRLALGFAHFA